MSTTAPSEGPPIDLDALRVMLGGDDGLVKMILEKFRAEILGDIEQLKTLQAQQEPEPYVPWPTVSKALAVTLRRPNSLRSQSCCNSPWRRANLSKRRVSSRRWTRSVCR